MKKIITRILVLTLLLAFTSCQSPIIEGNTFIVTFDSQGADVNPSFTSKTIILPVNTINPLPTPPTKAGFVFGGWYTDLNGRGTEFTENTILKSWMTVYAKWIFLYSIEYYYNIYPYDYNTIITECGVFHFTGSGDVVIPEYCNGTKVTIIRSCAFCNCSGLTSITLPSTLTSIGDGAFYDCIGLKTLTIPNGVTSIGTGAFDGCSGLTSLTLPSTLTSIVHESFKDCSSLISLTIPSGVTSIGNYAFYGCTSLTSLMLPSTLTSIGNYAFYGCSSLTSLTIPSGVTSIGWGAFFGCTSLTSLMLPSTLTSIEDYAFYGCSSLTSLTIPNGVTSIGRMAFNQSYKIKSLSVYSTVSPQLTDNPFSDLSNCTLHLKAGAIGYDVAPWNNKTIFSSIVYDL